MNSREAKRFVRKFQISGNCILLVKENSPVVAQKEAIGRAIKEMGIANVLMLIVEEMDDVQVFNKLDMNRLGWYRLDDINRLLIPRKEKRSESG